MFIIPADSVSSLRDPDWLCQCLTSTFGDSCGYTALDLAEWREMTEQTDWWAKQPPQVVCILADLKCWGAWDTACGHKAKDIIPLVTWKREVWKNIIIFINLITVMMWWRGGYVLTVCSSEIDHYFYICIFEMTVMMWAVVLLKFCSSQRYNNFYMCFYMQFLGWLWWCVLWLC